MVREGSRRFEGVEPLGNSVQVPYTPCYQGSRRFGTVEPLRTHVKDFYTPFFLCTEVVRGGSRGLNHSETVYRYPTHLVTTVKMRFEKVRYSRTTPNSRQRLLHTFFLCTEVVREGSRGFNHSEIVYRYPTHLVSHCEDEVREGSVQSNHSELTSKTSTHLDFSALKWFEKVRGGSLWLNQSEIVYRYPTHLVTTVKMRFEKVRYSRTTPNSRQRLLHTFLSLH